MESCQARAARMQRKTLVIAFYENHVNTGISSAPLDSHSAALVAISRAVSADKVAIFEHDETANPIAVELGSADLKKPAYALVDWVPISDSMFKLRVRFFDSSKPYSLDSLIQWVQQCSEGKECPVFSGGNPASSNIDVLTTANFDSYVNDNAHDILVAFVDKERLESAKALMQQVRTKIGKVDSVRLAVVDADSVPRAVEVMKTHIGSKVVPSVWMFPAGVQKEHPSIAFISLSEPSSPQILAQFAAQTANLKFALSNPENSNSTTLTWTSRPAKPWWRYLFTTVARWLGVFWIEF